MGCADGVDVVTLHEKEILFHELIRHSTTKSGVMFVAVDSAENDSLTIDFDQTIFHLDLSKANALGNNLIAGRDHKMVEVWRLSSPLEWVLDLDAEFSHTFTLYIRLGRGDFLLLCVQQLYCNLAGASRTDLDFEFGISVGGIQKRLGKDILDSGSLGEANQEDVTESMMMSFSSSRRWTILTCHSATTGLGLRCTFRHNAGTP